MTLDERAGRAAAGVHRAVRLTDRPPADGLERFEQLRDVRRRTQRLGAGAVAVAVAAGAALLIGRSFGSVESRQPAERRTAPAGVILFADYDTETSLSVWYTVRADGSQLVDLHISATCATWFPGGDRILITNDAAGVPLRPAVVRPDGSHLRPLNAVRNDSLELGCGDVSPDGTRIALEGFGVAEHPELNGIYSVRASDGGGLVRLLKGPISPPRYSPDGTKLAFNDSKPGVMPSGSGAVFVMEAEGGEPVRVTPWGYVFDIPAWSPDGRWITFQKPYGEIWVVHPDGTDLHRIRVELPRGAGAASPSWSPDGGWIVFSLQRGNDAELYRVRPDGTGLERVTPTGALDGNPDWTGGG